MRSPFRIYDFVDKLVHAWIRYPDLRLGQLISNALHGCGTDLFYMEDEDLIKRVIKYLDKVHATAKKDK